MSDHDPGERLRALADEQSSRGSAPRRRVGTGWKILLAFVALVVVGVLVVGGYGWKVASDFNRDSKTIHHAFPEESTRPTEAAKGGQNILLLGSDSRSGSAGVTDSRATGQRSDTIMVVHIPADHSRAYVMSIMRDMWVDVPGHGKAKINAALSYGGFPLVVETIEGFLKTRIDHIALIDFQGFKDMTTALGGVDVHSEEAFDTHGFHYKFGTNHLEGDKALAFVRERHQFEDGDYQRVRNQQAFMKGLLNTILSRDTLTSPKKLQAFLSATAPYLERDDSLSIGTMTKLGWQLRGLRGDDVRFFSAPTAGTGTSADGQSIVKVDDDGLQELRQAWADETLDDYLSEQEKR